MSLAELEKKVEELEPDELSSFARWFEKFTANEWDLKIENDALSGKLDQLGAEADLAFKSGQCNEL